MYYYNKINKDTKASRSSYEFGYDADSFYPPIIVIDDKGDGVPVVDNLVEVTWEVEHSMGKTIRFFPVVVRLLASENQKAAYLVSYSHDNGSCFTAKAHEVEGGLEAEQIKAIKAEWCRSHMRSLNVYELVEHLQSPLLCALVGELVELGVFEHRKDPAEASPDYYSPTNEVVRVCCVLLHRIFFADLGDCYAALKAVNDRLNGRYVEYEEYLDIFVRALEAHQNHPAMIRESFRGVPQAVEVYQDGVLRPRSSY